MDIKNIVKELNIIYTYQQLAEIIGVSRRMMIYYSTGFSEPSHRKWLAIESLYKRKKCKIEKAKK